MFRVNNLNSIVNSAKVLIGTEVIPFKVAIRLPKTFISMFLLLLISLIFSLSSIGTTSSILDNSDHKVLAFTGQNATVLSLETDKKTYGQGDLVKVTGTLDDLVENKTVRLDVYDPKGKVFQPFNSSFATGPQEEWSDSYPRLSDIQIKPNDEGLFSYRFPLDGPVSGSFIKGIYKIEVTYDNETKNATFTVR